MFHSQRVSAFVAALVFVSLSTSAFAQDYTQSNVSGQYITPPATGSAGKNVLKLNDDQNAAVNLPFEFGYYGSSTSTVYVHDNGYMQIAPPAVPSGSQFFNQPFPQANSPVLNGMCAPLWEDLNPTLNTNTVISTFTVGTKPNRKFVVDWSSINHYYGTGTYTFQAQLFENGTIVFAYGPSGSSWSGLAFRVGIDAPLVADTRFTAPNNTTNGSHPGTDYQFVPTLTDFEGTVLVDEIVSDATGIGNLQIADQPLAFVRIELVSGGTATGSATTDADGDFTLRGVALDGKKFGDLRIVAESPAGAVKTSVLNPPSAVTFAAALALDRDHDVGTFTLDDATDADFSERAPIAIAATLGKVFKWASDETATTIPTIDTLYDSASALRSSYSAGDSETAPTIRIGSKGSSNPDAFDTAMVSRMYARHILTQINSAVPARDFTAVIDTASTPQNALAEAFGLYVFARVFDTSATFDGVSSSSTTAFDLDDPTTLATDRGPDVGGWAAAALFDLVDDAISESHDRTDGTVNDVDAVPFTVFETLTSLPTPEEFRDEWGNQGQDVGELTRNFIHHGLLADDPHEPNDDASEASDLGPIGLLAEDLALNQINADWFAVTVEDGVDALYVDMTYNRFDFMTAVTLEVRHTGGTLLATGVPDGANGPIRAVTGPILAGTTLHLHVRHDGGDTIDKYSIQAYALLSASLPPAPDWTQNRPLQLDLAVQGGILPYTVIVDPSVELPTGLVLDAPNRRVIGAVGTVGSSRVSLRITDSGSPANSAAVSQTLTINPELTFAVAEFLGVPVARPTNVGLGRSGGTEPVTITNQVGVVPPGLQLILPEFTFTGTATSEGSSDLEIEATDVAGSSDTAVTRIVACVDLPSKNTPVDLAAGDSASGYFVDAVAGTTTTLKVKTAKKREKRALDLVVIGPDGLPVSGGTIKLGNGKAIAKKVPMLTTGRYFFILPSTTGGDTQLTGTAKLALPKKLNGSDETFNANETLEIELGALAGAKMTFKAKTKDGLGLRVTFLIKPDGTFLGGAALDSVTEKKANFTVTHTLDQSGTWKLVIGPQPGPVGALKWSMKLKQPKGEVFVAD